MAKTTEEDDAAANAGEKTLAERAAAFRSDPQLMEAATRFVNEVLEKAKEEAIRRMKDKALAEHAEAERGSQKKRSRWHSRARGFFMRLLASLCLCSSDGAKVS